MMNVGFGVTLLSKCINNGGIDGIGSYTRELLNAMSTMQGVNLTPVSFGETIPKEILDHSNNSLTLSKFGGQAIISAVSGASFSDSHYIKNNGISLYHATDHRIPKLKGVPVVATLMDAIPLSNPEWVNMRFAMLKFALWKKSAHWAEHVLTISEYSKQQIVEHFHIPENKISVIPLGVDARWFKDIESYKLQAVKSRYKLSERFYLSVGTIQPRKNIKRIIDAHSLLPNDVRKSAPLIIVGRYGWMCNDIVEKLESGIYGNAVVWLRHVPDEDLLALVRLSSALVFTSLSEGFGLPVLEAFASGTPVITSNTSSLPEVAGDAAILINPLDTEAISNAMLEVFEDSELVSVLIKKGRIRANLFTWDRTALSTVKAYQKVLGF